MKGTKVKCKDCTHSQYKFKNDNPKPKERKVLWCCKIEDCVEPYWTGCVMGDDNINGG